MKKAISYMACSMAAMLALSACGSAASSASTVASSSDAASTESTAASEASNEPVTITFAQYSGSGDNEQYLQQMVDNYMKENPNVTIDLQTYGYDDYFTQMTAKVSGGQAPDVFELDYQNFVSYAKKGALMPLDDILTKDGIDTSIYNDMALKAFSADGVQYGVPDSFSNVVLIYNKDLFDQAGIDYPTDDWKWEDSKPMAANLFAQMPSPFMTAVRARKAATTIRSNTRRHIPNFWAIIMSFSAVQAIWDSIQHRAIGVGISSPQMMNCGMSFPQGLVQL